MLEYVPVVPAIALRAATGRDKHIALQAISTVSVKIDVCKSIFLLFSKGDRGESILILIRFTRYFVLPHPENPRLSSRSHGFSMGQLSFLKNLLNNIVV